MVPQEVRTFINCLLAKLKTMLWATFNTQQRGSAGSDIVELIGDIHVSEKTLVDILRCLDGSVG